ncbi:pentapeptide repeat-containing protein [Demequina globuliformis]|uniref:pentapeptide repeat-containing protein n=1 Tax=Demequina globuliformis TaxID=676202 RepID=UPI000784D309|nr:pentapeptide repeat-containing protein [Demequina globuliformis]
MTTVASPRIGPLTLPSLQRADAYDLSEGPRWDDMDFSGMALEAVDLTDTTFAGCLLDGVSLGDAAARGITFSDTRLEGLSTASLRAPSSTWRRSELRRSRFGAAELHDGEWDQCTITGCKVGYLNLRAASVTDVLFEDCVFEDLDLMDAMLTRVEFRRCRVGMLTVRGARCADVNVVGLELGGIDDPRGLSGAMVSEQQVFDLAPVFAAHAGLLVQD